MDTYKSHTFEPVIGDQVVNTNPNCKHHGSSGEVVGIYGLPGDVGKVISYVCDNSGPNWSTGDMLEKTMDQLSPVRNLQNESMIRNFVKMILK